MFPACTNAEAVYPLCTGPEQDLGAYLHRTSGGIDIIHQDHRFRKPGSVSGCGGLHDIRKEGFLEIQYPVLIAELLLGPGVDPALKYVLPAGYAKVIRQPLCKQSRLIVAPLSQTLLMYGNGYQGFGPKTSEFISKSLKDKEGEKLKADIENRLTAVESLVGQIEQQSAGRVQAYSEKLYARLQELLGDRSIDEGRLVTEAAIFADKTAIDEETVRLHSHVAQYREILALDEPIGRKLDFLTQELNREANTIGSKCQDVAVTRLVVELKSEIEKIREQIQNIE